jgi:hypothetical protein
MARGAKTVFFFGQLLVAAAGSFLNPYLPANRI